MSNEAMVAPLSGTITVGIPVERAFRVFTESFNTWWPAEYHIGAADVAEAIATQLGTTVDRRAVSLAEPWKELGSYEVTVKLHPDVQPTVTVNIVG